METCPSFSQFLQEAAVLSQRQAEKLTPSLANNDEDQSIFKLADFFRTLTPSDCYDLALRLYLLWKKTSETPTVKKETVVTVPETPSDLHQKKKTFKNLKSVSQFPEKNDTFVSESETKSTTNYASPTRGNLFDYLHSESHRKNYKRLENEQKKAENEIKGCSFQPNTTKYQSVRSSSEVFDRLQQDLRQEKAEMNESKRLEIEMRDCTFTPALVSKRLTTADDVSMYSSRSSMNQTFDRLYKDHQIKKHHSIENELKKQELEVKGCTFQPALSSRNRSPTSQNGDYTDRFNQLYKLHSERQRSLMKKRIEKSEEDEKKYSFKPAIKASPAKRSASKGVQERLLEWNEKKNQKLELKLQEKLQSEKSMNQQLNLPARRESEITSPQGGQAFERLYQDSEMKKVRKEMLEKRVMKDVGASFTPKTNLSRNTSAKKQKENISTAFFGGMDNNLNVSRDEERFSKQRSPAPKKFGKQAEEQKAVNNALYRKHFLDEIQNNMVMDPDGKTATFGYY